MACRASSRQRSKMTRHVRLDNRRQCVEFYQCSGCHRRVRDPVEDLELLREAGHRSCCPERKMIFYRNYKEATPWTSDTSG
ncbi:hypothetical protein EVC24_142 [Rhizobium phage RHph_I4]|nr:hypothetical protein EVC24_142 [Rhizobium phage RHph_I4]